MTTELKNIADHYLMRGLFCREIGLWEGKMGMSLFFFLLSRHANNRWYEEFAGELLNDVCNSLSMHSPVNLAYGLCGIGWTIEFLKKEGFIEGNTDEILEEVDKQVMERNVCQMTDTSIATGLAGIAVYVRSRLNSERSATDYLPFDTEYLNDLDAACNKNDIQWKSDAYRIETFWQTMLPLLPAPENPSWQKGLMILNNNHG